MKHKKLLITRILLTSIIILTTGFAPAEDKKSTGNPNEYRLTYGIIRDEKDFTSRNPVWLSLQDKISFPTEKEIQVTVLNQGKKDERLNIKYGYSFKVVPKSGSILELNILLNKVKSKYCIRVKYQEGQWVYQRSCYMKLTLPEGTLYFFDENTNGRYNEYGIDGLVLPDSTCIIKLNKEIYLGKDNKFWKYLLDLNENGTEIKVTPIPLQGNPLYLEGLVYFNRMRIQAGLPQVALNETLCAACELHAKYMDLNGLGDGSGGLSAHDENPQKTGYTPEGAKAGRNSCIDFRQPNMISPIDNWMQTLFHRIPLVCPGTKSIGMGLYKGIALLDAFSDANFSIRHEPIPYPFEGQTQVPLDFDGEIPSPLPPNATFPVGFSITLTFNGGDKITDVTACLKDANNKPIEFYLSCPEKPAYAARYPNNMNTICVIPKLVLSKKMEYFIEIKCKVNGKDFTKKWSFTTVGNR